MELKSIVKLEIKSKNKYQQILMECMFFEVAKVRQLVNLHEDDANDYFVTDFYELTYDSKDFQKVRNICKEKSIQIISSEQIKLSV